MWSLLASRYEGGYSIRQPDLAIVLDPIVIVLPRHYFDRVSLTPIPTCNSVEFLIFPLLDDRYTQL